jgi:hypothetical protein
VGTKSVASIVTLSECHGEVERWLCPIRPLNDGEDRRWFVTV